ncbi:MAG: hypothetical protein ACYTG6_16400 [Planctomycetota bacterium]|jgi:hypothetical protein
MGPRTRHRILGSVVLAALPLGLLILLLAPGVRRPLGRTLSVVAGDWFGSEVDTLRLRVTGAEGARRGDPVFLADAPGGLRPVAHVARVEDGALRIRFAPDFDRRGRWRLHAYPASRRLDEAYDVAVTPEAARHLRRELTTRIESVLREGVLPELERRLPEFLARVDPRKDPVAREVLDSVGGEILERTKPYLDHLTTQIVKGIQDRFDFLERMGLLWKFASGDGEGLRRELEPVAVTAVTTWWGANADRVLTVIGEAVMAKAPEWQRWLGNEVFDAAREELAEPVFRSQRARLEKEAEEVLETVVEEVVLAPGGGFRIRFAAVLRSTLLDKESPLLLLERVP